MKKINIPRIVITRNNGHPSFRVVCVRCGPLAHYASEIDAALLRADHTRAHAS
jgi:hypothetical protein